jgi:hypothetical protein
MSQKIAQLFTQHPASVDETFLQHMWFALTFSFWLFAAAGAAFIHAILPFMFEKTGSQIITKLYNRIHSRTT